MEQSIVANNGRARRYSSDTAIAALLFVASAAVVIWQNSRLTILWDVSYILENAARIAAGDVPYRDFPFPYAPLTFLVQAAIIRLLGRAYWHHIGYAAIACGVASALTYSIIRRVVARPTAIVLSPLLAILGIYCILPNPFYDPDCCLAIVALLAAFLILDRDSILLGALCIVPMLIKQNIGLAFVAAALIVFAGHRMWRSVAGIVIGIAVAAVGISVTFGMANYIQWTVSFATARRLPPLSELLSIYNDVDLWWWIGICVVAMFFRHARWLIAVPFLWSEYRFFFSDDPNEAEINFLRFWPLFLVLGVLVVAQTLLSVRRQECLRHTVIALLIIAAAHGAFLSQITWGSTYGIWPLLVIVLAFALRRMPAFVAVVVIAAILAGGIPYEMKSERLTYIKLDGERHRWRGLTASGEWLPDFEELVTWLDRNVPRDDAILFLPGEDPLYFVTGRRPRFPVLMFDRTINPYDAATIARLADERHVRWVIIKQRLQINGMPMENIDDVVRRVTAGARFVSLRNYIVAERPRPGVVKVGTPGQAPGLRPPRND